MKKSLVLSFFCSINIFHSQIASLEAGVRPGVALEANTFTGVKEETLDYNAIEGSPFLTKDFVIAKSTCCNESSLMRYDIYTDEIQYQKDNINYTLLKQEPYSKIIFENPINKTLVLADVNNDNKPGYYFLLVDGKNSLLKKQSIKVESFSDSKKNSFGKKDKIISFKENEPTYYVKTEKGNYKLLKGKKEILELYPEKNSELNSFFDSNKIKFNREESLVKLILFLNQ
ncbi:hypothetical protein [Chryseobacterium turcicum]|uniref:Uncharacterized protein n=1 Tax=Chryseobacterium turcicum TaxID=2898076 RepID=A0A9Q3V2V6_9FLAO|nr:hypothetical protein [Chryseobacterium turcicum]MCD1116074.1 hypothetical protein [Chryseobacterium turcicum]